MEINLSGFLNSTSYGICSLNIIKSLSELGHKVSVIPFSVSQEDIPQQFHSSLQKSFENAQYWNVNAPTINIVHQNMMTMFAGKRRIGWPIFELDRFNKHELHHLSSLDEIIVCSQWAKNVCIQEGLTQPIHVVPLGVDTDIFFPTHKSVNENTVFMSNGKKELRKLHDKLKGYFNKAFKSGDKVELRLVWGNRILDHRKPKESADWTKMYQSGPMSNQIKLYEWLPTQQDVAKLLNECDCYIGLSRAEGWNLNLLEAMAVGKPVIANHYSGHTEFLDSPGNFIVPYRASEAAHDGTWFFGQGNWMEFDNVEEELIINYMREFHERKQELSFNQNNVDIANRFTWRNTAEKLVEVLS